MNNNFSQSNTDRILCIALDVAEGMQKNGDGVILAIGSVFLLGVSEMGEKKKRAADSENV